MKISRTLKALTTLLVTLFAVGCSITKQDSTLSTKNSNRIIGGTLVPANSPMAQSIVGIYDNNEGFVCTGSLLPNNLVVTAAHCIGAKAKGVFIVFSPDMESVLNLGKAFLKSPVVRSVVALKANEKWAPEAESPQPANDIGLMKYSGTTPDGYVPATFLTDASLLKVGATVVLAGYGVDYDKVIPVDVHTPNLQSLIDSHEVFCDTQDANTAKECIKEDLQGPSVLKTTSVEVTKIENPDEVVLDEAHGHAACSGDSGGPAYIQVGNQYQLWGATSRSGLGCNIDITYTNILAYIDWIKTTSSAW